MPPSQWLAECVKVDAIQETLCGQNVSLLAPLYDDRAATNVSDMWLDGTLCDLVHSKHTLDKFTFLVNLSKYAFVSIDDVIP